MTLVYTKQNAYWSGDRILPWLLSAVLAMALFVHEGFSEIRLCGQIAVEFNIMFSSFKVFPSHRKSINPSGRFCRPTILTLYLVITHYVSQQHHTKTLTYLPTRQSSPLRLNIFPFYIPFVWSVHRPARVVKMSIFCSLVPFRITCSCWNSNNC